MSRRIILLAAVCSLVAVSIVVYGQGFPLGLIPSSDEPVDAHVWTMESQFEIGEPITIHLRVSRPAFVYLFDLQSDGVVRLLFPNAFSSDNFVVSAHQLPDGPYELIATPPTGIEELLVFASTMPLPFAPAAPTDPFPLFATSATEAIDTLVSLFAAMDPSMAWGVGWTAIQIAGGAETAPTPEPPATYPEPPSVPPFPANPGDAWHEQPGGWSYGIPEAGWYWYYGFEGHWHLCWVYDH